LLQDSVWSIDFVIDGICNGMMPLHIAACKGYIDIVWWIIHNYRGGEQNMDVKIKEFEYTPL
jgi:hypothetical protein